MYCKIKNNRIHFSATILPGIQSLTLDNGRMAYPFILAHHGSVVVAGGDEQKKEEISWGIASISEKGGKDGNKPILHKLWCAECTPLCMLQSHYCLEEIDDRSFVDAQQDSSSFSFLNQDCDNIAILMQKLSFAKERENAPCWAWELSDQFAIEWSICEKSKAEIKFELQKLLLKFHYATLSAKSARRKKAQMPIKGRTREMRQEFKRKIVPDGTRRKVMERDGFTCVDCGRNPRDNPGCILEVDHRRPVAMGGSNEEGNLQTLCDSCNRGKGAALDWKLKEAC